MAWDSTYRTNLKKNSSQQKHAIRIVFNKNKFAHTREIFKKHKFLNVYQLNILSNMVFIHRVENKTAPSIFQNCVSLPTPIQQISRLITF